MKLETVIGLEIHVQLKTASKLFSGAKTNFGGDPNSQACALDLALPGTLPVLNKEALRMGTLLGLSVGADISRRTMFARKNYFYPDLPKGYQVTQDNDPIVENGYIDIDLEDGTKKQIHIERAHLEEDAGKLIHAPEDRLSYVDLNRAGVPLVEIVSAPDMRSPKEAVAYLKAVHTLVRYLGISTANMQEGAFRCDANISLRPFGQKEYGQRVELKNINSFRFVEKALNYEVERQAAMIEAGETIKQQTRLYDSDKDETRAMRSKENAHDYRYFTDPDIMAVAVSEDYIAQVKSTLPELPWEKQARFISELGLTEYDASVLAADLATAHYFEATLKATKASAKLAANWVLGTLSASVNKHDLSMADAPVTPQALAGLIDCIADDTISGTMAKDVFEHLWDAADSEDARSIIDRLGLKQMSDDGELLTLIQAVLDENPTQLEQYRAGKDKLFGFFVGQMMRRTKGQANPAKVNELLRKQLDG